MMTQTELKPDCALGDQITREQYLDFLHKRLRRALDREGYILSDEIWAANAAIIDETQDLIDKLECNR